MKMKKVTALMCAAMMAAGLLAGCGGGDAQDSVTTPDAESQDTGDTTDAADAAGGDVTQISFYTTQSGTDEEFLAVIEAFEKENPDIKVEYLGYDSSELQKWMSLYASNDAPRSA